MTHSPRIRLTRLKSPTRVFSEPRVADLKERKPVICPLSAVAVILRKS